MVLNTYGSFKHFSFTCWKIQHFYHQIYFKKKHIKQNNETIVEAKLRYGISKCNFKLRALLDFELF